MSNFLSPGQQPWQGLPVPDERARKPIDRWWGADSPQGRMYGNGVLWTRGFLMSGDHIFLEYDGDEPSRCDIAYEDDGGWNSGGGQQQRKIVGTTYDGSGSPLGSVVVDAYVTATDTKVGSTTSDAGGYYECPTPMAGSQHYLVAYKAGSPDVAGTTVNTIVPT